ncbi:glycosyl hydrolase 115 family protein [Hymenobacter sp. BT188]|uniref:glycosyl hydrolase 115 family protein n=1 Tax=Hymenobacter sp. BT188 TaxID=2763504 RepID=UPI0016518AED|nr:glycosyl hydrolase 115 family protein [Hymenobacter sp. BT188]MBC6607558.1 glycosyl hydrolase 115 family protein [Hymenobacter sp. BT188]
MRKYFSWLICWLLLSLSYPMGAQPTPTAPLVLAGSYSAEGFALVHEKLAAPLYLDNQDAEVVRVAADALARDIANITSITPALRGVNEPLGGFSVLIGTVGQSKLIDQLAAGGVKQVAGLKGKWEAFSISVVDKPFGQAGKALVIAGSDRRGTAFGVFELSRRLGVSPWYWWADVTPHHQDNLYLTAGSFLSASPTVKYRGIFLNDEDWGLQPWAAQNLDKDIKDIGPNTYARIFELLLRLKANLIWPAMHPSTRAFFSYPSNPKMADRYAILVGTSHAEPMLRNNVDEWKEPNMGPFDYFRNKPAVYKYWEQRVKQAADMEVMYSLGMRGVHDSGMEGAKNPKQAAQMLHSIIADQREILRRHVAPDVPTVPQVFTAYKEVLDIYDEGLKLPDDVTLVWPDDNYGYISRLSNAEEQTRGGGSGVYYHASYWGRPHDYLWLSSTHPALIREEMMKAHELKTDRLWVLNVGDIKPLEYNIQLFLDMAYDARPFQQSRYVPTHLKAWASSIFGDKFGPEVQSILWEYYDLAFERRPEFMGWSQTEPTTPTQRTAYNHFGYGDEAQRRLDRYAALRQRVQQLRAQMEPARADAFFELVYYPVVGAALMNQKFLYQDKSYWYALQHRASATDYALWAQQAYASIELETEYYNNQLAGSKWRGMMSMKPRNLPVYQAPILPNLSIDTTLIWGVAPEGFAPHDSAQAATSASSLSLPTFYPWGSPSYFIDVFLSRKRAVTWKAKSSVKWLTLSAQKGTLTSAGGQKQQRLQVHVDWRKVPKQGAPTGFLTFTGAGKTFRVVVRAAVAESKLAADYQGFIEINGCVSMLATHYSRKADKAASRWALVEGLGHAGQSLQAQPLQAEPLADTANIRTQAPAVEYDFYTFSRAAPIVTVYTLPTHPTTRSTSMRYGVALDNGPIEIVDFKTVGRSEEWKQNVLRNRAQRQTKGPLLSPGRHTLTIYLLDPGVVLDHLTIDLGGLQPAYSLIPETWKASGLPSPTSPTRKVSARPLVRPTRANEQALGGKSSLP